MEANFDFSTEINFTKVYRENSNQHPAIREAMCLKAQFPAVLGEIEDGDKIAGRVNWGQVGFSPHNNPPESGYGYYCNDLVVIDAIEKGEIPLYQRDDIWEMLHFWKQESSQHKVEAAFNDKMKANLFYDMVHPLPFNYQPMIGQPIYRMAGIFLDYQKLLHLGLSGLREKIAALMQEAEFDENKDTELYKGMLIALDVFSESCIYCSNQAKKKAEEETNPQRILELQKMSEVLEIIANDPPNTFREALQLSFLYSLMCGTLEFGRMDVYLADFFIRDIEHNIITRDEALDLMHSVWQLINDQIREVDGRVVIGGKGRHNEDNANEFALLALETTRTYGKAILPQLTLRFYDGMDQRLMETAYELFEEGHTFPLLYNDDVLVPAVSRAFDVPLETAEHYMPLGCGEIVLDHMGFGTPSGAMNVLKALEVTMRDGIDPVTGNQLGLKTGKFHDFENFEDFFEAYKKQLAHVIEVLADHEELEYIITGEQSPFLLLSMLYDDCLERGLGIFSGGIRYLGGTLETYGNVNSADSLTAIKELVFDKKLISPKKMLEVLDHNFVGYEQEWKLMKECPKYGNDLQQSDSMMVKFHDYLCNKIREQSNRTNLHSYLAVIINNAQNTTLARWVGATPDGRKAGAPMANANTPAGGNDKNGITALINSIVQPDPSIHAGSVQNLRFGNETFKNDKEKVKIILSTYFNKGGSQAMLTVINKGDLERAIEEPELYKDLFVRVGGFSARFVDLPKDVQVEIISRTTY